MYSKIYFPLLIVILGVLLVLLLVYPIFPVGAPETQVIPGTVEKISEFPVPIKIPSISIDAHVEQVGFALDKSMDVPELPNDTAWFDLGPRPGELGSAVIDGHSGYKDDKPAVFDSLYKIKIGDKIYITDNQGLTNVFVVRKIQNYIPGANDTEVFTSNDGLSHLNLITCSGTWNTSEQTHSERLVVFTDKVST